MDREWHPYDPSLIAMFEGQGDKGVRAHFSDGAMRYLGQVTWRNPIMPDLGFYLQFTTTKGKTKWVKASECQ